MQDHLDTKVEELHHVWQGSAGLQTIHGPACDVICSVISVERGCSTFRELLNKVLSGVEYMHRISQEGSS